MDKVMMKQNVSPVYYKMYAAISFFVAGNPNSSQLQISNLQFLAKSIELDERIPFIPRLKRKCELKESQTQIKNAEVKVLEACDWNPLYTTVLEVLEFYLTQGILFSTDEVVTTAM